MACEFGPPFAQGGFADMESLSLFAYGLEYDMDVRMRLISMKHHSVSMLEPELFPGEILHGGEHLVWRRSCRHGEQQLVNQLCRAAATSIKIRAAPMFFEIEIPALN